MKLKAIARSKWILFGAIWIALFVMTMGARLVAADRHDTGGPGESPETSLYGELVTDLTKLRLRSMTREHDQLGLLGAFDGASYPISNRGIHDSIINNRRSIRDCVSEQVQQSDLETNYLEFSFSFTPAATILVSPRAALKDVAVEKSTLPLNTNQKDCLAAAFERLSFDADSETPNQRVTYTMCINKRHVED